MLVKEGKEGRDKEEGKIVNRNVVTRSLKSD